jgi:hypothetical protein
MFVDYQRLMAQFCRQSYQLIQVNNSYIIMLYNTDTHTHTHAFNMHTSQDICGVYVLAPV